MIEYDCDPEHPETGNSPNYKVRSATVPTELTGAKAFSIYSLPLALEYPFKPQLRDFVLDEALVARQHPIIRDRIEELKTTKKGTPRKNNVDFGALTHDELAAIYPGVPRSRSTGTPVSTMLGELLALHGENVPDETIEINFNRQTTTSFQIGELVSIWSPAWTRPYLRRLLPSENLEKLLRDFDTREVYWFPEHNGPSFLWSTFINIPGSNLPPDSRLSGRIALEAWIERNGIEHPSRRLETIA